MKLFWIGKRRYVLGVLLSCLFVLGFSYKTEAAILHKTVPLDNTWVTQTLSADEDYLSFDFFIPSDGKLVITVQAYRNSTYIYLYDDDKTIKYFRQQINYGSEAEPGTQEMTVWLKSGTYHYVAADNMSGSSFGGAGDIRVKMLFTAANNTETEPNDDLEHAMLLEKGRIVKGALLKIDDRYDFYKITPQPGNDVACRLTSYAEAFAYTVYDSQYQKLFSGRAPGSESSPGVTDFKIEAPAGSLYYIKISDDYVGEDHTFGIYTLQWLQECNHTFDAGKVEKPATTSDGLYTYTCTKCGEEKHEVIPAISIVKLNKTSYTYNGKTRKPKVVISDRNGDTISSSNYKVTYPVSMINADTYTVKVDFKDRYSGSKDLSYKIKPASQKITGVSSKTYKQKVIKKEKTIIELKPKAKTKLSYSSDSKYLKVSKKGIVTISTKTPKGIYTITIKAKKTQNYKAATKKIKIRIK